MINGIPNTPCGVSNPHEPHLHFTGFPSTRAMKCPGYSLARWLGVTRHDRDWLAVVPPEVPSGE